MNLIKLGSEEEKEDQRTYKSLKVLKTSWRRGRFKDYCDVDSVKLVAKNGTPKCFGFVNFLTHADAVTGLRAHRWFFDPRGSGVGCWLPKLWKVSAL